MVEIGEDEPDYAERISADADATRDAWEATLGEMEAMGEELTAEGWETVTLAAGHTAPETPDSGDHDRFGLTHVVPDNRAGAFAELFEDGAFTRYEVYRNDVEGREFVLTALYDDDREVAVLVAGSYRLRDARGCVAAAKEAGRMYTHVQTLDGTHLGSFEHADYETFFPHADRIENWDVEY